MLYLARIQYNRDPDPSYATLEAENKDEAFDKVVKTELAVCSVRLWEMVPAASVAEDGDFRRYKHMTREPDMYTDRHFEPQIVIPAAWWPALCMAAYSYGGIGSHQFEDANDTPLCVYGMLARWGLVRIIDARVERPSADSRLPFSSSHSDEAVDKVRQRLGLPVAGDDPDRMVFLPDGNVVPAFAVRVPFAEWAKEMNIVRGRETKHTPLVVPAFLWDYIERYAATLGGVGAGEYEDDDGRDLCLFAIAAAHDHPDTTAILNGVGLSMVAADEAVEAVNKRKGVAATWARVPFAELAAELQIRRGE